MILLCCVSFNARLCNCACRYVYILNKQKERENFIQQCIAAAAEEESRFRLVERKLEGLIVEIC